MIQVYLRRRRNIEKRVADGATAAAAEASAAVDDDDKELRDLCDMFNQTSTHEQVVEQVGSLLQQLDLKPGNTPR